MTIKTKMFMLRYHAGNIARRCGRAIRYAMGRSTIDDAWQFHHDSQNITGFRCLEGLSEHSVLDALFDQYGNNPALESFVTRACSRVADKWNSSDDIASAAEDWAVDLVREYATEAGISLMKES